MRAAGGGAVSWVEPEGCWYAIYTRARHEKQVDRLLSERQIATYLPLVPRTSHWKDRRKLVEWPLFPSYVFARFDSLVLHEVLAVPGVASVVRQNGELAAIPAAELENVRRFVAVLCGNPATPPQPVQLFPAGQWVEILDGPFAGIRGQVIERRSTSRLLVGLAAIQQGFEINVAEARLRPVPAAPAG